MKKGFSALAVLLIAGFAVRTAPVTAQERKPFDIDAFAENSFSTEITEKFDD